MFDFFNFIALLRARLTQQLMVEQASQMLLCLDPDPAPNSSLRLSTGDFQNDRMFSLYCGGLGVSGKVGEHIMRLHSMRKVTYFIMAFGEKTKLLKELKVLW